MQRLALLNLYPLHDGLVHQHDRELHQAAVAKGWRVNPIKQTQHASSALEFARLAAGNRGANAGFTTQLELFLKSSPVYRSWCATMPPLYEVPGIDRYRDERISDSLLGEMSELPSLSSGQFLFHGGVWPGPLSIGATVTVERLLSTSLSANPAVVHADKDRAQGGAHIWIIEVGPDFDRPVYAYNMSQRRYKQEFEVLIAPGFTAKCVGIEVSDLYTFISVLLG